MSQSPPKQQRPPDTLSSLLTSPALGCSVFLMVFLVLLVLLAPRFFNADLRAHVAKANGEMRSLRVALFDYRTAIEKVEKVGILPPARDEYWREEKGWEGEIEIGPPQASRNVVDASSVHWVTVGEAGTFPPAGGEHQKGWRPWDERIEFGPPNAPGNGVHACSVLWVPGSFYDDAGDRRPNDAAPVPDMLSHYDLRVMTSPIEAITAVPNDPFKNEGKADAQYDYFALDLENVFVLRSLGPDRDADIGCGPEGFRCACKLGECLVETGILGKEFGEGFASLEHALQYGPGVYSPTNGSESSGDIWYLSTLPESAYPLMD